MVIQTPSRPQRPCINKSGGGFSTTSWTETSLTQPQIKFLVPHTWLIVFLLNTSPLPLGRILASWSLDNSFIIIYHTILHILLRGGHADQVYCDIISYIKGFKLVGFILKITQIEIDMVFLWFSDKADNLVNIKGSKCFV